MKKLTGVFIASAIFITFYAIGQLVRRNTVPAQNSGTIVYDGVKTIKSEPNSGESAMVTRVIDGDTIELQNGERVRYIGMDAPETVDPRKPIQCFGREAAGRNRELVEGKLVRLAKDVSERDKYGRLLRYVWVGDVFVNLELVKEGYASVFTLPPDVKHSAQFVEAEREAKAAEAGLWSACDK